MSALIKFGSVPPLVTVYTNHTFTTLTFVLDTFWQPHVRANEQRDPIDSRDFTKHKPVLIEFSEFHLHYIKLYYLYDHNFQYILYRFPCHNHHNLHTPSFIYYTQQMFYSKFSKLENFRDTNLMSLFFSVPYIRQLPFTLHRTLQIQLYITEFWIFCFMYLGSMTLHLIPSHSVIFHVFGQFAS